MKMKMKRVIKKPQLIGLFVCEKKKSENGLRKVPAQVCVDGRS